MQSVAALCGAGTRRVTSPAVRNCRCGSEEWISECAKDLLANTGKALVVAGHRQPLAVHLLAHAINAALGQIGKTVVFHEAPESKEGNIDDSAKALNGGKFETLVILGGNPVYNAPADSKLATAQRKAKTVVRLGYYEDETSADQCDWHLPLAHYLESWGDALTSDGTLVPIQPLIEPLFGGLTEFEVLARIAGEDKTDALRNRPRDVRRIAGEATKQPGRNFCTTVSCRTRAAKAVEVQSQRDGWLRKALEAPTVSARCQQGQSRSCFPSRLQVDDGRYNNNGWLQEMPDPITKIDLGQARSDQPQDGAAELGRSRITTSWQVKV